jgi:hypothetical protein
VIFSSWGDFLRLLLVFTTTSARGLVLKGTFSMIIIIVLIVIIGGIFDRGEEE